MSKFGGFLARKAGSAETSRRRHQPPPPPDNPLELDEELFSALGAQLGGDNESLRNLLLDANAKIGELDSIKAAVGKLVDPVSKTLRDFEAEKTEKVGLQTVLNNTRTAYGKLRNEVGRAGEEDRGVRARMQGSCARIWPPAQSLLRTLETTKSRYRHRYRRPPRADRRSRIPARAGDRRRPRRCARRTAGSTSGWPPPTSASSRSKAISTPRASAC